jgi:hypothetical protein
VSVQVFVTNDNFDLFDTCPRTSITFTHGKEEKTEIVTFLIEAGVIEPDQSDPAAVAARLLRYFEAQNPYSRAIVQLRALSRALSLPPPPKAPSSH